MKSPFPYFGGKSKISNMVWQALGDVPNYVEPFAGSLAVLLARPHQAKIETVNDKDCMIANFWRALSKDPDAVAHHADWPVNEADLEARHYWLVCQKCSLREMLGDPDRFDAKIAGWWVWGICAWIGGGWCCRDGSWQYDGQKWLTKTEDRQGINRQLPHLRTAGQGINQKRLHLGDAGQGINRQRPLITYMRDLAERLRRVRVCCGEWDRICGPSPTIQHGLTGVFLDPPYANGERASGLYSEDCGDVAKDVTRWALENGDNKLLRIVVTGYDVEHAELTDAGWTAVQWKTHGGYGGGRGGDGDVNKHRETIWFSPHCLGSHSQMDIFARDTE